MESDISPGKNELRNAIIETMAFFDIFGFPLTPLELWRGLKMSCTLGDVLSILDSSDLADKIEGENGFYFLRGRAGLVEGRMRQYNLADCKFSIALRAIRKLRYINGVEMMGVCNNFSYREDSDIDFFIIVQRGRMWLTRFLVTLVVHFLGLRRHDKRIANRACLSFYISDDALNIEKIAIERDFYLYHWMGDIVPIYGFSKYKEFWQSNSWLLGKLPNAQIKNPAFRRLVFDNFFSQSWKLINTWWFGGLIGDYLEKMARFVQRKKMAQNLHSLSRENDSRVIISNQMLKFHEGDRRVEYRDMVLRNVK